MCSVCMDTKILPTYLEIHPWTMYASSMQNAIMDHAGISLAICSNGAASSAVKCMDARKKYWCSKVVKLLVTQPIPVKIVMRVSPRSLGIETCSHGSDKSGSFHVHSWVDVIHQLRCILPAPVGLLQYVLYIATISDVS